MAFIIMDCYPNKINCYEDLSSFSLPKIYIFTSTATSLDSNPPQYVNVTMKALAEDGTILATEKGDYPERARNLMHGATNLDLYEKKYPAGYALIYLNPEEAWRWIHYPEYNKFKVAYSTYSKILDS